MVKGEIEKKKAKKKKHKTQFQRILLYGCDQSNLTTSFSVLLMKKNQNHF